jgi:hypothetical protein
MPRISNIVSNTAVGRVPSAYRLNDIILINHRNVEFDITNLVAQFSITESIFQPFLSIELRIRDSVNLLEEAQLVGQERVRISFSRDDLPTGNNKTVHTFVVTDYPGFKKTHRVQAIILKGISEHAYLSRFKKISRAFNANVIDLIRDILINDLNVPEEKINLTNESSSIIKGIIPALHPLNAIFWLLRRAYDSNGAPFYCYETLATGTINILSHSEMVSVDNEPHETYHDGKFFTQVDVDDDYNQKRTRILDLTSDIRLSKFIAGSAGAYASQTKYVDVSTKEYFVEKFNYSQAFESMATIDKNSVLSNSFILNEDSGLDELVESHENYVSLNQLAYDDPLSNYHASTVGNGLARAQSYLENSDTIIHDVKLHGDSTLATGATVNLVLAASVDVSNENEQYVQSKDIMRDAFLSGRYVVSGIVHTFGNTYFMEIRCKKDSFTTKL